MTDTNVISDDMADVTFNTHDNAQYQFEFTPRLDPPTWTDSGGVVTGAVGTKATTVTTVTTPTPGTFGIYRVRFAP